MPPQPRWRCCSTPSSHRTRRARDPSEAAWRGPHRREDRGRDAQPRQRVRPRDRRDRGGGRSEEHTSELQSQSNLVCRLLLEKKKTKTHNTKDNAIVYG